MIEIFPIFAQKSPKNWTFGQKSGGLFEFCIGGGLIKSGGLFAWIRYAINFFIMNFSMEKIVF